MKSKEAQITVVKLKGLEAAALAVLAESAGVSPEKMLQDLIRRAATEMVTGRNAPLFKPNVPASDNIEVSASNGEGG